MSHLHVRQMLMTERVRGAKEKKRGKVEAQLFAGLRERNGSCRMKRSGGLLKQRAAGLTWSKLVEQS